MMVGFILFIGCAALHLYFNNLTSCSLIRSSMNILSLSGRLVMITLVVQIGNSDNKLSQSDWSKFVKDVDGALSNYDIHFRGGSPFDCEWQNACWVVALHEDFCDNVRMYLLDIRERYNQDSIAVVFGDVEFI